MAANSVILKKLIDKHHWEDIEPSFKEYYPNNIKSLDGFERVFFKLKEMEAHISNKKRELRIEYIEDKDNSFHAVDCVIEDRELSISFIPWSEILGMSISEESIDFFLEPDIICHSIWEMTFHGFTEKKIQNFWNKALGETI